MTQDRRWRKSTWTQNSGTCVELPGSLDTARDSKHPSPILPGAADIRALIAAIKGGQLGK